tara:strand:+ start:1802 stop:2332 length:531 start_codon:yes stop_codon:yes gene_type:complete
MSDNWIQGAVKKPGALRATAKREGLIEGDEKLSGADLSKLAAQAAKTDNKKLAQRVNLAKTFAKMRKSGGGPIEEQDMPESWWLNKKPSAGGMADMGGVGKDNITRSIKERRPIPLAGGIVEHELGAGEKMVDDIDRMDDHSAMIKDALEALEKEGDWEVEPPKKPKYFIGGKPVY